MSLCFYTYHISTYRFEIAFGSLQSITRLSDKDLSLYQCIILKAKSTPFGVSVYNTRFYISFEAIFKVASITGSLFIVAIGSGLAGV